MHDDMQYKSESDSDIETARANAIYYKRQAEAEHAELLELRERINACLQVTEISNKEHNKKNARIAALESALREIEQNAGQCVTLEQANWTIERIKQRAAAALK